MRALKAAALSVALLVAGCAVPPPGAGGPDRGSEPPLDPGMLIAEQGPPRERARIHTELAAAYYGRGHIAVALEEARIAIAADSSHAPAYGILALVHADMRENDQAQANFERALQLSPADPDINHNYGWFLCQTGREEQSLRYFLTAVRNPLYTTPQKSYVIAAACSLRKNMDKEAVEYYERALRLDQNYPAAVMGMAQLKYKNGDLAEARKLASRYNMLIEPTAESLWLALRIERRLGNKAAENSLAMQLRREFSDTTQYQELLKGQFD